jgi:hypothetical protein
MTDGSQVLGGTTTIPAATNTQNQALPNSFVINRSVPFISARDGAGATGTADLDDTSWKAVLTTPTNLQLAKTTGGSNSAAATVAWFVVQFATAPNLIDGDGREIFP